MNKTAIKNFAIWARNKLIADISYRAGLMGITAEGIQNALPQSTGTTEFYDIGTAEPYSISGDAVKQRKYQKSRTGGRMSCRTGFFDGCFQRRMQLISTSSVFSRVKREPRISISALAVSSDVMQGMPRTMARRWSAV